MFRHVNTKGLEGHIAFILTVEVMQVFFKDRLYFQRRLDVIILRHTAFIFLHLFAQNIHIG